MPPILRTACQLLLSMCAVAFFATPSEAERPEAENSAVQVGVEGRAGAAARRPTLDELKVIGKKRSRFADAVTAAESRDEDGTGTTNEQADLARYESTIKPLLEQHCFDCHGVDATEGNIRVDTLNPDLLNGPDTEWWSEVFAVVTKGEMPPPDAGEMEDGERQQIVDWLSQELQTASIVRRQSGDRSAFRRMTRYEYNYALQDLLGLPWDFAKDLPPEPQSEDGFENNAELLQLSASQFETYYGIARTALERATVKGEKPATKYWGISMEQAAEREWPKQDKQLDELKEKLKDDPEGLAAKLGELQAEFRETPRTVYYKELSTDRKAKAEWRYHRAQYAFAPQDQPVDFPEEFDCVAVLPNGRGQRLIFELGNQLPDEGTMRVTVRASSPSIKGERFPSLQLLFGWQASNEGRALLRVSDGDTPVTAGTEQPQLIQWDVPLGEIYPRNSVRKTSPMGVTPSPSEYVRVVNSSAIPSEIHIDYVQVEAPVYDQWPPESHRRILGERDDGTDELTYARQTISTWMRRAWRRPVNDEELESKLNLFRTMRPSCDTCEDAILEVLATVLSSPQFLYVTNEIRSEEDESPRERTLLDLHALANRLSLFLWCSIPDEELLDLAESGRLADEAVLASQVQRMLGDPRSERFAKHFVYQWLDMQLLEFQNFKQHIGGFDPLLKEAMQHEPIAMFDEMLRSNASLLDLIHCDYAMVNERLARHYGLSEVFGNHFRRVTLSDGFRRGGILTQAGVLAMNSDWPDSHPLKRAIWLLESVLNDPPPPPPPAVPQIDLADPEIAKMTLKERIEDHRNHAACMSCHIKIDPWGIAFENYDALGKWRDQVKGKPVDASSELFNHQTLDGMDGLKRFLLENRQDQLVRAVVSKLSTYALGRPLAFADRAQVDAITAEVRKRGDGLRTVIDAIVESDLFRSQ